jgi:hypothetical protein
MYDTNISFEEAKHFIFYDEMNKILPSSFFLLIINLSSSFFFLPINLSSSFL